MSTKQTLVSLSLLLLTGCGQANLSFPKEAWDGLNDPLNLNQSYERHLATLPQEGSLDVTPWSDTYWPSREGGIASRWMLGTGGFDYTPPDQAQVQAMSMADLAKLSPAEKFDIFNGNFNYPLLQSERGRTGPTRPSWEGICHGWAPASISFTEPKAVLATSAAGVAVPFGSSDVKALLSLYTGNYSGARFRALGARCNYDLTAHPELANRPECRDTNAGAFHIVLTNQIALMKQGFVADVTRDLEVWNQPVHGFKTTVLSTQAPSPGAAVGTVQEAVIDTEMFFSVEIYPRWDAVVGTEEQANDSRVYHYRVELNDAGEIIGGEWLTSERPDFLWTKDRPVFAGQFAKLGEIYDLSQTAAALPDPTLGE